MIPRVKNVPERACPFCGTAGRKQGEFQVDKQTCDLTWCSRCDLYYLSPPFRFPEAGSASYYDDQPDRRGLERADHYGEPGRYPISQKGYRQQLAVIERWAGRGKLLDVGCGFGGFLFVAQTAGWDCYGVEISPLWGEKARRLLGQPQRIMIGSLSDGHFPLASFRVIHLRHVIEHLSDPQAGVQELVDLLEPGGIIVMETPNSRALVNLTYGWFARWRKLERRIATPVDPPFHLFGFSPKSLDLLLSRAGFVRRLLRTTRHGDPTWRFKNEDLTWGEFYGPRGRLMSLVHRLSAWLGRGDNLLAIYQKPGLREE